MRGGCVRRASASSDSGLRPRAWQAMASGASEIAQKQRAIFEEAVKDVTEVVKEYKPGGSAQEIMSKQSEFAKKAMEAAIAEAGGMMYMEEGIKMETIFGDGSQQSSGFLGALKGAGKRLLTGESLFMTVFQNVGQGKRRVAFGAPYPGKIIPVHLGDIGGELLAQKDSFLCAAKGVSIGIASTEQAGYDLSRLLALADQALYRAKANGRDRVECFAG